MSPSTALRQLVESTAPRRPWSGQAKNGAHVRSLAVAVNEPYLQLNPPSHAVWLLLDLDYDQATLAWEDQGLPPPTFVATNRDNGNAQLGYALAAPVCVSAAARDHPMRYLAAIEYAYVRRLDADAAFAGPLAKNPLSPLWRLWEPANCPMYELGELAEYVTLPKSLPRKREAQGEVA